LQSAKRDARRHGAGADSVWVGLCRTLEAVLPDRSARRIAEVTLLPLDLTDPPIVKEIAADIGQGRYR